MERRRAPVRTIRRRHRVNVRRLLLSLFVLLLIIEGFVVVFTSPRLHVEGIKVLGARTVPVSDIIRRAALASDTNILLIRKRQIVERLKTNPVVADACIYRDFPNSLTIRIFERRPYMVLLTGGRAYKVDPWGVPFTVVNPKQSSLTHVAVPGNHPIRLGARLVFSEYKSARKCLAAARARSNVPVSRITVDGSHELSLILAGGLLVKVGRPLQLEYKMSVLSRMLEQNPRLADMNEYVDVTCPDAPAQYPKGGAASAS